MKHCGVDPSTPATVVQQPSLAGGASSGMAQPGGSGRTRAYRRLPSRSPAGSGQFTATPYAAYDAAQSEVCRMPHPGLQRFYDQEDMGLPWKEEQVLPAMWTALHASSGSGDNSEGGASRQRRKRRKIIEERLWTILEESQHSVERILNQIGAVLHMRAKACPSPANSDHPRQLLNPLRRAFIFPLLKNTTQGYPSTAEEAECMYFDPIAVSQAAGPGLRVDGQGYLQLTLAYDSRDECEGGRAVIEGAHRLVLWTFCGPPNPDILSPVVMHSCNHPNCLSPCHMCWGSQAENLSDVTIGGAIAHLASHRIQERLREAADAYRMRMAADRRERHRRGETGEDGDTVDANNDAGAAGPSGF